MRRLAANYIFPVSSAPIRNGILEISDEGEVLNVIDPGKSFRESRKIEFYNGILVPGFINCHCHLELSSMKNQIPAGTGLKGFIKKVRKERTKKTRDEIERALKLADIEMKQNGIIACGDISNTASSFQVKSQSVISYYTFIELFGFQGKRAENIFQNGKELLDILLNQYQLTGNLIPHAAYSVSSKLFELIFRDPGTDLPVFSFHFKETSQQGTEELIRLKRFWSALKSFNLLKLITINSPEKYSTEDVFRGFPAEFNWLLVHNTYAGENDIDLVNQHLRYPFWVLCPNSNLHIEQKLPDIPMLIRKNQKIAIGTDSLASNDHLSVFSEILTIQNNFPQVSTDEIIRWGTLNGAEALNVDSFAGSFEPGKRPGVNLITNFDFSKWKFKETSKVKTIL